MKEIPKFHETFIPLLETLKSGELIKGRELSIRVRDNYYADLSDDQLSKKLKLPTALSKETKALSRNYTAATFALW